MKDIIETEFGPVVTEACEMVVCMRPFFRQAPDALHGRCADCQTAIVVPSHATGPTVCTRCFFQRLGEP